jgi:hypothetical protein
MDFYIRQLNFYFGQSLAPVQRSGILKLHTISFTCHLALAGSTDLLLPGTWIFQFDEMFVGTRLWATSTFVRQRFRIKRLGMPFFRRVASSDMPVEVGQCNAYWQESLTLPYA